MATATLVIDTEPDVFARHADQSAMLGIAEFDDLLNACDEAAEAFGPAAVAEETARRAAAEEAVLARIPGPAGHAAVLVVTALAKSRREGNELHAKVQTATAAFDAVCERHALDREQAVADALRSHGIEPDYSAPPQF